MSEAIANKTILWWGRHGNYGPDYPRNRTIIRILQDMGCRVIPFQPKVSALAHVEANLRAFGQVDLVWVPCFRQRDLGAAARWAHARGIPVVFDPLISAYDKQANERRKFQAPSARAQRLLNWERSRFALADHLIADTRCHSAYFAETLGYPEDRLSVIPVSAEETLFFPDTSTQQSAETEQPPELLFLGTFISLQGATTIARAAQLYDGPRCRLTFLGDGPDRAACEDLLSGLDNSSLLVGFEDWIPLQALGSRIRRSDICLGVFGDGEKARRVIPNKVYQALACDRPVITMRGDAYPDALEERLRADQARGLIWTEPAAPAELAAVIADTLETLSAKPNFYAGRAHEIYREHFSNAAIREVLQDVLTALGR